MQQTPDPIVARVSELVAEQLGRLADDVAVDTDLRAVEGVDSVKTLRIIAKAEKEFDLMLEDEEVFGIASINDLADLIRKRTAHRQP